MSTLRYVILIVGLLAWCGYGCWIGIPAEVEAALLRHLGVRPADNGVLLAVRLFGIGGLLAASLAVYYLAPSNSNRGLASIWLVTSPPAMAIGSLGGWDAWPVTGMLLAICLLRSRRKTCSIGEARRAIVAAMVAGIGIGLGYLGNARATDVPALPLVLLGGLYWAPGPAFFSQQKNHLVSGPILSLGILSSAVALGLAWYFPDNRASLALSLVGPAISAIGAPSSLDRESIRQRPAFATWLTLVATIVILAALLRIGTVYQFMERVEGVLVAAIVAVAIIHWSGPRRSSGATWAAGLILTLALRWTYVHALVEEQNYLERARRGGSSSFQVAEVAPPSRK